MARNHWLDLDDGLTDAAATAARIASPRTPTAPAPAAAGMESRVAAEAGLTDPGAPPPPRAVISTAAGYTIGEPPTGRIIRPRVDEQWPSECWAYYDAVGELHYVAGQYARAVSRGRLYVARYDEDGEPKEVTKGEGGRVNRELLGGEAERSDLLYLSAVQQFMSGQSLITVSDAEGWDCFSDQDFSLERATLRYANRSKTGNRARPLYKVDVGTGTEAPLADGTLTIHMWDRHPGRSATAESTVRPALPYLRELARLDQYVQSILLSRIALSGILQLPPGTEVIVPPEIKQAIGDTGGTGDGLMHVLASIGVQNISNPGTAAAVLPVLLQMAHPDQKLEHLTLDQPLAGVVNEFRELNLRRLSMSLDLAPEAMSGFSNVKYSNAEWILAESVQTHIVRRLNAFASALTRFYVVPLLDKSYTVQVDISDLESDEDRTTSAIELYDRGEIDGDSLRRKAKMKDTKPPTAEELLRQLAVRAVTINPSLFPVLAPLLGLRETITLTPEQEAALTDAGPGESGITPRPLPDRDVDPPRSPETRALPNVREPQELSATVSATDSATVSAAAETLARRVVARSTTRHLRARHTGPPPGRRAPDALLAACDVVVCSALASAGSRWRKRVRARASQTRGTDSQAVYLIHPVCADHGADQTPGEYAAALVADRWPQVPRIAALHAANPDCLQATLAAYVTGLLVSQAPHHPAQLGDALADCLTEAHP